MIQSNALVCEEIGVPEKEGPLAGERKRRHANMASRQDADTTKTEFRDLIKSKICKQCAQKLEQHSQKTKCPICRQEFLSMAAVHSRETAHLIKNYAAHCEQCKGIFKISELRQHMEICKTPEIPTDQQFKAVSETSRSPPA
ncbi:hypothetical protein CAPTEDRAFT_205661 [Capitella teleta]|uniref:Uncharacterized protein n=1 Tax=Capitella teleta TaxID=283909 RepID=R7VHT2_CAPTE|nr:hypothetical protein CAPTEDRAFT_205661 [Capitella teleta]|eukprot:ELU15861.1 hypothetical protein CAPTEDRAFT_205661 [Capitella teleta]